MFMGVRITREALQEGAEFIHWARICSVRFSSRENGAGSSAPLNSGTLNHTSNMKKKTVLTASAAMTLFPHEYLPRNTMNNAM
jgi:hypothetical protein